MNKRSVERYLDYLSLVEDFLGEGMRRPRRLHVVERVRGGDDDRAASLRGVAEEVAACTQCPLHRTRSKTVPGAGSTHPLVLVIGEGPGADEDRSGIPFVGAAGRYLDKWLAAIDMSRDTNCFIANIVKCRPPGNRDPEPDERAACLPYLIRQIEILKPSVILTLGRVAAQTLLETNERIGKMHGNEYVYRGIPLIPTYHPSGVLRNPGYRRSVWDDLRTLKALVQDHGRNR